MGLFAYAEGREDSADDVVWGDLAYEFADVVEAARRRRRRVLGFGGVLFLMLRSGVMLLGRSRGGLRLRSTVSWEDGCEGGGETVLVVVGVVIGFSLLMFVRDVVVFVAASAIALLSGPRFRPSMAQLGWVGLLFVFELSVAVVKVGRSALVRARMRRVVVGMGVLVKSDGLNVPVGSHQMMMSAWFALRASCWAAASIGDAATRASSRPARSVSLMRGLVDGSVAVIDVERSSSERSSGSERTSRVVPGFSLTIARRRPRSALKSVLLPAFGGPTRTTFVSVVIDSVAAGSPASLTRIVRTLLRRSARVSGSMGTTSSWSVKSMPVSTRARSEASSSAAVL